MTTYTLRPNADVAKGSTTLTGGATAAAVMSDNSDASFVQHLISLSMAYSVTELSDLPAISTNEQPVSVRVRMRYTNGATPTDTYTFLENTNGQQCPGDYYTSPLNGTITTVTGAWRATAPDNGLWTVAKINALRLRVVDYGTGTRSKVYETYVDVLTNTAPYSSIDSPAYGASVTDTTQPDLICEQVDLEADPMDAYEAKLYTAAQYTAGINPDVTIPIWTTGVFSASWPPNTPTTVATLPALMNGSYWAYLRIRQGGAASVPQIWSPWIFSQFTIAVTLPRTPTVTATPGNEYIGLALQDQQNNLSADDASFEGGIGTWKSTLNCSVARSTTFADDGAASLKMTSTASGRMDASAATGASSFLSVIPGSTVSGLARLRADSVGRAVTLYLYWFKTQGGAASTTPFTSIGSGTDATGVWTQINGSAVVPADANAVQVAVSVAAGGASESHYVDKVQVLTSGVSATWSRGGLTPSARFEVQRSVDGGTTWAKVSRLWVPSLGVISDLSNVDYSDTTQHLDVQDYEVPRGSVVSYRVRVGATAGTSIISSDWSSVASVTSTTGGWTLRSLTDPANSWIKPNVHSPEWTLKSTERLGVFNPLGRKGAVVISDVIGGEEGTLTLSFPDDAGYRSFQALRARRETMLLQSPYGDNLYIRFGADRTSTFPLGFKVPKRIVTIPFVEVDV